LDWVEILGEGFGKIRNASQFTLKEVPSSYPCAGSRDIPGAALGMCSD
jgi:hypothetical protein